MRLSYAIGEHRGHLSAVRRGEWQEAALRLERDLDDIERLVRDSDAALDVLAEAVMWVCQARPDVREMLKSSGITTTGSARLIAQESRRLGAERLQKRKGGGS